MRLIELFIWILPFSFSFQIKSQVPHLFAPEIATGKVEFSVTMTPDQQTIYFVKTDSFYVVKKRTIYRSTLENQRWSSPVVASFSGQYSDSSPFVSPDGKKLFFTSKRPVDGKSQGISNIWYVALQNKQEGEPVFLEEVNSDQSEYSPSVDIHGHLYFGSYREGGHGSGDLWVSYYKDEKYQAPQNLGPPINTPEGEWGSCIATGGDYIIFENSGKAGNLSPAGDLFISYSKDGQWQAPVHFNAPINSIGSDLTPRIHGDHLYFASNRKKSGTSRMQLNNVDLYFLPLEAVVREGRGD